MKIMSLHKQDQHCALECCGKGLKRLDLVNKMNNKYYELHCGRLYRLHVAAMRWIRGLVNGKAN